MELVHWLSLIMTQKTTSLLSTMLIMRYKMNFSSPGGKKQLYMRFMIFQVQSKILIGLTRNLQLLQITMKRGLMLKIKVLSHPWPMIFKARPLAQVTVKSLLASMKVHITMTPTMIPQLYKHFPLEVDLVRNLRLLHITMNMGLILRIKVLPLQQYFKEKKELEIRQSPIALHFYEIYKI